MISSLKREVHDSPTCEHPTLELRSAGGAVFFFQEKSMNGESESFHGHRMSTCGHSTLEPGSAGV